MTKEIPTLQAALRYAEEYGFSVIPLSKSKVPFKDFPLEKHFTHKATREEILLWWEKWPYANVGIVTGSVSGLFVVDFDKYDPKYDEQATLQYFPDSIITPSATTPRGGEHLYFAYPEGQEFTIKARSLPGTDYRANHGYVVAPPSVNGDGRPYQWKVNLADADLAALPSLFIDYLCNNNSYSLYKGNSPPTLQNTTNTTDYYTSGTRDNDLFHAANVLVKGGGEQGFIEKTLELLALGCTPPFPVDEVKTKIESAMKRAERRERNLSAEIREWITLQEGYFNTTNILQTLQLTTREEKKNLTVILTRLNHEGIIEKYGERRGQYRTVQKLEENIIDLTSADTTCLNIKFPLGIHDLVKIMPKNIIIIAGESNAGKTAFLLNTAAKNMLDHPVFYFSSEMGGAELKERLQNYQEYVPFDLWKHCTFIERANDFDVAIRPDAINIIDFLEIHDEFYKIGGYIKKIFDKLNKGIAIIAIQKNKGRDDGLGGARSIEKARLYLSMAPGTIKIVKAKNWVSSMVNPNGLQLDYKLAKGMVFKADSNWAKSDV